MASAVNSRSKISLVQSIVKASSMISLNGQSEIFKLIDLDNPFIILAGVAVTRPISNKYCNSNLTI